MGPSQAYRLAQRQ